MQFQVNTNQELISPLENAMVEHYLEALFLPMLDGCPRSQGIVRLYNQKSQELNEDVITMIDQGWRPTGWSLYYAEPDAPEGNSDSPVWYRSLSEHHQADLPGPKWEFMTVDEWVDFA